MSVWTLVAEEILYSTISQTVKRRASVREHRQHRLTQQPGTDGSAETGLRRRLSRTAAHGSSSSSISAGPTARCSRKQNETQRPRLTAVVASSYLHRLCCREDGTKGSTWHTHTHIPLGGEKRPWLNQSLCGCYSWVLFNRCYPTRRSCWLSSSKERQSAWCHAATLTTESCKQSEENWLDDDLKKLKKKKIRY